MFTNDQEGTSFIFERYTFGHGQKNINNMSQQDFEQKDIVVDAVIRNLEVIGEAAKSVPIEVREEYPHIPWKRMIGLRNIMIHEYFGIDLSIVWTIVKNNLPEARRHLEEMFAQIKGQRLRGNLTVAVFLRTSQYFMAWLARMYETISVRGSGRFLFL